MTATEVGRRHRVLVVEDDALARGFVSEALALAGYAVDVVGDGCAALNALEHGFHDVVLLDLQLPGVPGLGVLSAATAMETTAQFIVMTASGSVDDAVDAMKLGAYDYLQKPLRLKEVEQVVAQACAASDVRREMARLRAGPHGIRSRFIGCSPAIERLFDLIERVAPLRASVLITGETGTGKELVARAIHDLSGRTQATFVPVDCSALPESLLESELFGHVKGSFTGAVASRRGLFEVAGGGTLFLDEISAVSPAIQVKLLRVLQDRMVRRVGSTQAVPVDFRLVAATNVDLALKVGRGEFREDLFYRLNVFPLPVPPLRERRSDIPLLVNWFSRRFAEENGIEPPRWATGTLSRMQAQDWPGNVRELENFVERAVIMSAGSREVRFEPSPSRHRDESSLLNRAQDEVWPLERVEQEHILAMLERTRGHRSRTAELLGIDRRTLYRKLRAMGVNTREDLHDVVPVYRRDS